MCFCLLMQPLYNGLGYINRCLKYIYRPSLSGLISVVFPAVLFTFPALGIVFLVQSRAVEHTSVRTSDKLVCQMRSIMDRKP
jgi:hypothetical protein